MRLLLFSVMWSRFLGIVVLGISSPEKSWKADLCQNKWDNFRDMSRVLPICRCHCDIFSTDDIHDAAAQRVKDGYVADFVILQNINDNSCVGGYVWWMQGRDGVLMTAEIGALLRWRER